MRSYRYLSDSILIMVLLGIKCENRCGMSWAKTEANRNETDITR